jgi:Flp pilus assembly protein TadD
MSIRLVRICTAVGCVAVFATWTAAQAEDRPEQTFDRGNTLLQKGDFEGALEAFTAASKANPDNDEYRQQALLIRRVIALRDRLGKEEDAELWLRMATSLHGFYHQRKIYSEALTLDQRIHARLNNADSATMLARTQLALKNDSAAAALLQDLPAEQATPEVKALYGIALARQGKLEAAKAVAESVELPKEPDPQLLFDLACLRARTGDTKEAFPLLQRSFELTPPSRLAAAKAAARECFDLMTLKDGQAFAAALKTESQVKESACSAGASCGKCPSRAKCAGQSKDAKGDEGSCPERPKDKKPEKP